MKDATILEILRINYSLKLELTRFFEDLQRAKYDKFFHPHSFTVETADRLSHYQGLDLYYVLMANGVILAYGFLRGWDKGFDVPSLGIAVHPNHKGKGFGTLLMNFLHVVAKWCGASQIRLKVYEDNNEALRIYRKLGYSFNEREDNQLIGYLKL